MCLHRYLNKLKKKVANKVLVEGSIFEAYLMEEVAQFHQSYFDTNSESHSTRIGRTECWEGNHPSESTLSILIGPR